MRSHNSLHESRSFNLSVVVNMIAGRIIPMDINYEKAVDGRNIFSYIYATRCSPFKICSKTKEYSVKNESHNIALISRPPSLLRFPSCSHAIWDPMSLISCLYLMCSILREQCRHRLPTRSLLCLEEVRLIVPRLARLCNVWQFRLYNRGTVKFITSSHRTMISRR